MSDEEYKLYQKAVNYIVNNINNSDFTSILRQYGYKIIPTKLSYVIENLEKAGYTVSKNITPNNIEQQVNSTFNKDDYLSFIKNHLLSLYTLIKDTTIFYKDNKLSIIFDKQSFFKYKQCSEKNNKDNLTKLSYDYLKTNYELDLSIDN